MHHCLVAVISRPPLALGFSVKCAGGIQFKRMDGQCKDKEMRRNRKRKTCKCKGNEKTKLSKKKTGTQTDTKTDRQTDR